MPLGGPLQALEVLPRPHVPELLDNGLAQVPPFGQAPVVLLDTLPVVSLLENALW